MVLMGSFIISWHTQHVTIDSMTSFWGLHTFWGGGGFAKKEKRKKKKTFLFFGGEKKEEKEKVKKSKKKKKRKKKKNRDLLQGLFFSFLSAIL